MPRILVGPIAGALLTAGVACGGSGSSDQAAPRAPGGAPAGKRVDPSTAGSISGLVLFAGTPPSRAPLDMASDSRCRVDGSTPRDESIVVDDGGLENVFVYVKSGLGDYAFDTPTVPAKLDQEGCMYKPRVLGVRVGQPLQVDNSDATAHNVHAAPGVNEQLNTSQPFRGMTYTHSFSKPEIMVPFKCDIHPWMIAWVGVVTHPYFAVTSGGGRFELKTLPPGTFTLEAWHEKLGRQTATVTLGPKESKELSLTFKAS